MGLIVLIVVSAGAQNITLATGGENISADDVNGPYTDLTDIIVDETSEGQFSRGVFILRLPEGFEWDVNSVPNIYIEAGTGYSGKGTALEIEYVSTDGRDLELIVQESSDNPPNKAGKAIISGLYIRPTTTNFPTNGNIMATGPAVPNVNDTYGWLSLEPGTPEDIFIETAPDGSGNKIGDQNITAGDALTGFAISRDQGGNFIENVVADSWSLDQTGLSENPLAIAEDSRSATFSSSLTGSASITASSGSLTAHPAGVITVTPDAPAVLEIQQQPSLENTVGEAFSIQPVLEVKDQYSNPVPADNFTSVTATRESGVGRLSGTTSATANGGTVSFIDLHHTIASDISLRFSASGLEGVTSDVITIAPASADSLTFITQPPNGSRNTDLDPAPEVQLLDTYGNEVAQPDVEVSLEVVSGAGNISGTGSIMTNEEGVAIFDAIKFNPHDNQDNTETYIIKAVSGGFQDSENSDAFTVADAGTLAGFNITTTTGEEIPTRTSGEPFNIQLAAVDGAGDILDGQQNRATFNGYINLSTTSEFSETTDTTEIGPFIDGEYTSHEVELIRSGINLRLEATNSSEENNESGSSNLFTVNANSAFPDSTHLSVHDTTLTANGSDTTRVTVQLRDILGNPLTAGGDEISLVHNGAGNLSAVTDHGDGTYSAILTAPTDTGVATLSVTVNGDPAAEISKSVDFKPGPLATFLIEDKGSNSGLISDQRAGDPFEVTILAKDAHNNTVGDFDGKVEISSESTILSGGDLSAPFVAGVLHSHSITLSGAGDHHLKARNAGHSETGTSNTFFVSPAPADAHNSLLTVESAFLKNDPAFSTTVTAQLMDQYGNVLVEEGDNSVAFSLETSSDASLSNGGNTTYDGGGAFSGTLTASSTIENVAIVGSFNSSANFDTVEVVITEINEWISDDKGNRSENRDWGTGSNWALSSGVPTIGQVVQVLTGTPFYPVINQNATIDFLDIHELATVNLEPGYTMDLNYNMSGDGTFICDRSTVNIAGNLTVATYASSTCHTIFSGDNEAVISGRALTGTVTIDKDMTLTGSLQSLDSLIVTEGNTLVIEDGAELDIQGPTRIDGELKFNGGHMKIGDDVNGSNISIENTNVEFNGTDPQDITGLDNFDDLIINNPDGVTFHNDVEVDGTLILEEGVITIDSGYSLVTNEKSGNLGDIRMLREISGEPGWRMISSPLKSTYKDLLDSTVTQGYENSMLELQDEEGDSLQPNVLYYLESHEGTDNQRWRAPVNGTDELTPGQGLYVYFFGDIPEDARYNKPLPYKLSVMGEENRGDETSFNFDVSYTSENETDEFEETDMGFNMVGNPFAATIDWGDGNWTKENMDDVIYVWDPSVKDYRTWNGIDGSLGNGLIMPFQGFWVRANGLDIPKLAVHYSSKRTTGDGTFKGKEKKPASIEFLMEADSLQKETHLTLSHDGKTGKDLRDAYRLLPFDSDTYLEFYSTLENGSQLAINNLPREFGKEVSIPFYVGGFKKGAAVSGEYTLSWPSFGNVPDSWTMILKDQKTGREIDLRKNTFYSFQVAQAKRKQPVVQKRPGSQLTAKVPSKAKSSGDGPRFLLKIDPGADAEGLPEEYSLDLNYPNPFSGSTTIQFATPLEGHVELLIYDVLGRKVKTLVDEDLPPDFHEFEWTPRQLASGMYICVMRAGGKQLTRKMTYIK